MKVALVTSSALTLFLLVPVHADVVVYSNFGPGSTFDSNGWTINGFLNANTGQQVIAQKFTPASDFAFAGFRVAVSSFAGPDKINVFLQQDESGKPGSVLEEIAISDFGSTPVIVTGHSVLSPTLRNGIPYWLTLVAGADGVVAGWHWNSIGDVSESEFLGNQYGSPGGPWAFGPASTRSAFEIDGTQAIPEPGTVFVGSFIAFLTWSASRGKRISRG